MAIQSSIPGVSRDEFISDGFSACKIPIGIGRTLLGLSLSCIVHCLCWLQKSCARSHLLLYRYVNCIVKLCGYVQRYDFKNLYLLSTNSSWLSNCVGTLWIIQWILNNVLITILCDISPQEGPCRPCGLLACNEKWPFFTVYPTLRLSSPKWNCGGERRRGKSPKLSPEMAQHCYSLQ